MPSTRKKSVGELFKGVVRTRRRFQGTEILDGWNVGKRVRSLDRGSMEGETVCESLK